MLRAPEAWGILVLCVRSWSDVMTRHESLHAFFASEIWEDILFQIGLNHSIFWKEYVFMKDWFEKLYENASEWRLIALFFLFIYTLPIFGDKDVPDYFIKVMQRAFELGDEWRFILWVLYSVLWVVLFVKVGVGKETEDQKWRREQKQKEWDDILQYKQKMENLYKEASENKQNDDIV